MVGDGSYLMMAQEIVTAVQEGIKLDRRPGAEPRLCLDRQLSESVGSQRFGTRYRYRDPRPGALDGDVLPVDLAANAAEPRRRRAADVDHRGVPRGAGKAKRPTGTTVVHVETDPLAPARRRRAGGTSRSPRSQPRHHPTSARRVRRAQAQPATVLVSEKGHPVHDARSSTGSAARRTPERPPALRTSGTQRPAKCRRRCCSPSPPTSTPRSQAASEGVRDLVRRLAHPPGADHVRLPRAGRQAHRRAGADRQPTSTARWSTTPRARSSAASRSWSSPAGIPQLLKGEFSEQVSTDVDAYSFRQPLGVVRRHHAVQLPGDGPDVDASRSRSRRGNTFVLKPSRARPVGVATSIAELYAEAGLPDGVFNVVHGDKVAVDAILDHPGIAAVSFVGSTPIAKYVYERGASHGKRVQALGGAKNHAVVLPDADLDFAADHITAAGYGSAGQRCMAISAVVAVGDAGDALVAQARREGATTSRSARATDAGRRDGSGRHAEARGPGRRATSTRGAQAGRHAGRRRPRPRGRRPRGRLLRRPDALRPGARPTWTIYTRRDLRPGAGGGARGHASTRRSTSSTRTRTAMAQPSSPQR